jgi:hypothetical protein
VYLHILALKRSTSEQRRRLNEEEGGVQRRMALLYTGQYPVRWLEAKQGQLDAERRDQPHSLALAWLFVAENMYNQRSWPHEQEMRDQPCYWEAHRGDESRMGPPRRIISQVPEMIGRRV